MVAIRYFCLSMLLIVSLRVPLEAALSNRQKATVRKRIVPAYHHENTQVAYQLLSGMLDQLDDQELQEINQILEEAGAPTVGTLLLDARLRHILPTRGKSIQAKPREAALVLPVLYDRIETFLRDLQVRFGEELPAYDGLKEYQDAYWDIHVAQNRVKNTTLLARHGVGLAENARRGKLKGLTDEERSRLDLDFHDFLPRLERASSNLHQVKAELRIRGVRRASEVIRSSREFKERLRASYIIGFDGPQAIRYLEEHDAATFTRPALRQEDLLDTVRAHVRLANESAGDLAKKSRLLYLGMHWWLRGRYGQGPEGLGLLKSRAALTSAMAQFPLFMPVRPPVPTDPAMARHAIPSIDRRHHYIWMYEPRRLFVERSSHVEVDEDIEETKQYTSRTKLSRFY